MLCDTRTGGESRVAYHPMTPQGPTNGTIDVQNMHFKLIYNEKIANIKKMLISDNEDSLNSDAQCNPYTDVHKFIEMVKGPAGVLKSGVAARRGHFWIK